MSFDNMPATLFSPAKIVYVGFLVLAGLERIRPSAWVYVLVSVLFIAVEVIHNDYIRILLNRKAEAGGEADSKEATR